MTTESKPKRKYVTLSDDDWETIREEWESGDTTLADLSDRFGASIRSLQLNFERHGVTKGSARTAATLDAIRMAMPELPPADASDPETVKSSALQRILAIEDAISDQLLIMRTDPSQAFRCGSTVKTLQAAIDALGKSYSLKREVLGLDREQGKEREILIVRELFEDDIRQLHENNEDNDDELPTIYALENDIVVEAPA